MMVRVKVNNPGLLTTFQDEGRFGYQQYGMPVSGAMDLLSLHQANYLVGNKPGNACLEITAMGPELQFDSEITVAICGGDLQPELNGMPIEMYRTLFIQKEDVLKFGVFKKGFRAYLAFSGSIELDEVMGSCSTYLTAGFGGYKGRKLQKDDEIKIAKPNNEVPEIEIPIVNIPDFGSEKLLRFIAGPEANQFKMNGLATFLREKYTIGNESNRMGYRLEGPKIKHKKSADIISSGIAFGTIQITSEGQPIIMMADRQTTGGYTRIGNVISADLPYLAQLRPGNSVSFKEVSLEDAGKLSSTWQ